MKLNEFHSLTQYFLLHEGKELKNVHLEHIEDLVYNKGHAGALQALDYLNDVRLMLADGMGDATKITVKWDGAPAIVCGVDPHDSKFFVGTKSVFAKTPKMIKSPRDIDRFYGDEKSELKHKLGLAFKYLRPLGITGVIQGDMMFTEDTKFMDKIGTVEMITFTPNTITYAVPVNSHIGQKIKKAKFGIIFHTTYEGPNIEEMRAIPGVNLQGLAKNSNVWYDDATYKDLTGRASLTDEENAALTKQISQLRSTIQKIPAKKFDVVLHNKEFAKFIKPYINSLVWAKTPIENPIKFLKGYMDFYGQKMRAEMEKLKTGKGSAAAKARVLNIKKQEEFLEDNMNVMLAVLAIYKQIAHIKLALIRKLNSIDSMVGTFRKDADGYHVINPEGFVVVGHYGNAVKLVDRLDFSAENRMGKQEWKKK